MKLKKWANTILLIIAIISFMFLGADSEDLKTFIVGHLINTSIFILSTSVLLKYGRI